MCVYVCVCIRMCTGDVRGVACMGMCECECVCVWGGGREGGRRRRVHRYM